MQRALPWILITLGVGIALIAVVHGFFYDLSDSGVTDSAAVSLANIGPVLPDEHPVRLSIPTLNIDAFVEEVGVAKSGRMATPRKYADVAWFKFGTVPGRIGSAVIAGHVDNGFGLDAVFKHLDELAAGDEIFITQKNGTTLRFVVEETQLYKKDEVPDTLFRANDTARLTLITCGGTLIKTKKEGWTYDHRLVIYAVRKST